ncbi:uncharacterized protein A1O9_07541 [Exophiala aquamarina CBS 119918]|uniref:Uncharacterized protein n=1 Tax=Exophiala aquamarina CBS 119918 TaxID=1182545 RepID=A0A072P7X4_9EURO|nr:uncharacterized protein A1O9_07541 [Exophiala aquamarina CBS 119918]KEF55961.1 hypothetical protein A1O9_07541 [Exophiala aquamarina CBS 119918]
MPDRTVILITGSSRGIGKALLSTYLLRPKHTLIAGLRDPTSTAALALQDLPHGTDSKIITVKIDSTSSTDAQDAAEILVSQHGITKLDMVIANAGVSKYFGKARVTPATEMADHFAVNAVAPLLLFQATASLLDAAAAAAAPTATPTATIPNGSPKFVVLSSGAGSIGLVESLPVENTAYGASKAAANFVTRRIHYENPRLIAFPINPGWLQTDLGNHAAKTAGMTTAPVPIQDGVNGVIDQIDRATREDTSGQFMAYNGEKVPW